MPDATLRDTPLGKAAAGLDACVHCGFCLPACPTYIALDDENDSPRGRLVLMRAMLEGDLPLDDPAAATHIDRCLGCRACETACPSGVPYGHLLEATRATVAAARPLPLRARVILGVFARPRLLRLAMLLARGMRATRIPLVLGRLRHPRTFPLAMLASTARPRHERTPPPTRPAPTRAPGPTPAPRAHAPSAAVLTGCVMEGLLAPINRATERALAARGHSLVAAPSQQCCGALHAHAGDAGTARTLARANIAAFEASGAEIIVVNSAGCGAMLREYGHLLHDDPAWRARAAAMTERVRDISEVLVAQPHPDRPARPPVRVAYDAPCHLYHAQRIIDPPVAMLRSAPGVTLVALAGSEQCCGSAGIYNLIEPSTAAAVLAPKIAAIDAAEPDIVATGNPGCLMQIGAGLVQAGSPVRARHPVELVP